MKLNSEKCSNILRFRHISMDKTYILIQIQRLTKSNLVWYDCYVKQRRFAVLRNVGKRCYMQDSGFFYPCFHCTIELKKFPCLSCRLGFRVFNELYLIVTKCHYLHDLFIKNLHSLTDLVGEFLVLNRVAFNSKAPADNRQGLIFNPS